MIANNDALRAEGLHYATPKFRNAFAFLLALDNELWAARKKAKEVNLARIRVQFFIDDFENVINNLPAQTVIFQNQNWVDFAKDNTELIKNVLAAHFDDCGQEQRKNVFFAYFRSIFVITGIENDEFCQIAAEIFENAIKGDFKSNIEKIRAANTILKTISRKNCENLMPAIAFLKLCKSPVLFNEKLDENGKSILGLRAKFAIFGAILFLKI